MRERNVSPILLRVAVILAILICLTAAIGAVPAHADNSAGTVTASALNMRSGPSTSYSVVTCVPRGTQVLVTGSSNGWYQVQYQNMTGYMSADYVSLSNTASGSFGTGTVKGTYVNVRSGPGLNYSVIGSTNTGDSYSVTGVSGSWYKINYKNATGYIFNSYLTTSGGSSSGSSGGSSSSGSSGSTSSAQGTGVITGDYVRMRTGPSTSYSILGTYMSGTKMTITGQSGDWYAVSYNGTNGYVYKQYLSQSGTATNVESMTSTAAVTTTAVHLREGPSTAYTSKRVMPQGASITLTGKSGQWYKCTYNGESGFVHGDYVSTNVSSTPPASSSAAGDKIVAEAKKYLGVRYVYGGATPSGFDCSGFVYYVYRQCGYSITRTATAQNSVGTGVARGSMQPGDIIIFYNGAKSAIGHSGIYIGNNQFIHASSGGGKVMISGLNETYYNTRFYSARRVVS